MSIANDFLRPARIVAIAAAAVFLVVSANGAFARGGGHGGGHGGGGQRLHGPGTSHNPIIVGQANGRLHGPGTSHNPIIAQGGRGRHHHGHDHDRHASNIRGNCQTGCVVHQHGPMPSGQPSGPMRQSFM